MSKLLDEALIEVRKLPDSEQDGAAGVLIDYMSRRQNSVLTDEQRAEVRRRLADPNPIMVRAVEVWKRLGLDVL